MLGIDVSKATLACTLVDPQKRQVRWARTVPNTPPGIQELLQATPPRVPWVLEPTGRYSLPVVRLAQEAGRRVLLAPPRQAKAFLQALQPRAKTDRLDSYGLARYALAIPLRPYRLKDPAVETLEQLLAARRGLAQSISRLEQQRKALPLAAEPLTAALHALQAQLLVLDRRIAQQTTDAALPGVAALDQVPGIGPVTAAAVAARLAAKDFRHPDQFVAYVGLDIKVRQSGQRQGEQALTKRGDAELRRLLFLCARANLRSRDPANPFKQQYERELAKGLPSTAATCAVARKLARLCWSLVTHGTSYDPARVHQQPRPMSLTPLDTQP